MKERDTLPVLHLFGVHYEERRDVPEGISGAAMSSLMLRRIAHTQQFSNRHSDFLDAAARAYPTHEEFPYPEEFIVPLI